MRVLMLVASPVLTDVRVLREAVALVEAGHTVDVVGRDVPSSSPPAGVRVWDASGGHGLRPGPRATVATGAPYARGLRRAARWMLLPEHRHRTFQRWRREAREVARSLGFDVVHAHDYTALPLGAGLARERGVPLVYDAHELWTARHRSGRPTPVLNRWQRRHERRLGAEAALVLTVGELLADRLRDSHGWGDVRVVRNTFPTSTSPVPLPEAPVAAVYAGRLSAGRDLATVAAASRSSELPLRLVGPRDATWASGFDPLRAVVEDAVEPAHVDDELRAAGLALVTLEDGWDNHRVALPNKLFQAVAAGVPLVASDGGELARTVRRHGLGTLYAPGDAGSLVSALDEARGRYAELRRSVAAAQDALGWPADRARLLEAYEQLATPSRLQAGVAA